jgi:hypothetical protein
VGGGDEHRSSHTAYYLFSSVSVDRESHLGLLLYPNPKSLMEGCLSDRLLRNARINEVPAVAHARNFSLKKGVNKNA